MTKLQHIYYLTDSKEIEFIRRLADNDKNEITSSEDFRENVLKKLFIHEDGQSTFLYLKNKYLYLFTEGAIRFIEANQSMSNDKTKLADIEKNALEEAISKITDNELNIFSLGAGTSETEINAIKSISDKKINYFALDVSLYLLQLGVINYTNQCGKNDKINFKSILADIWDAAKTENIKAINSILDRSKPTIFTFFGGTIGNYPEKKIIKEFLKMMNLKDTLIIGYDTWFGQVNNAKNELYDKYNTIGNLQFLIQPLHYIPRYSGYINHFSKYFSFSKEDSILIKNSNDNEYDKVTNVSQSIVYAPYLKLPNDAGTTKHQKIRLAQSTKYKCKNFTDQDNELTKCLVKITEQQKTLSITKTIGEKTGNLLGNCVSTFEVIERSQKKVKTSENKQDNNNNLPIGSLIDNE